MIKRLFNDGWQFALGEPADFSPVALPHDWLIGDPENLYRPGVGWYRRTLEPLPLTAGQRVFLRFDGVYMDSTLYVNGTAAGEWKCGYTPFEHEITNHLRAEEPNELLLRVSFASGSARWYTGAGVYRDVFLIVRDARHFAPDGVYITAEKQNGVWTYRVHAEVASVGAPCEVRTALLGAEGGVRDWDIDAPNLYTLRTELWDGDALADADERRVGFRTVEMSPDGGFVLNGRRIKLNGVCLHHDLGALGAAAHRDAIRRQLTLFKQMGVNAIRTAHNPPAEAFLDLCDEMGFLVLSELTDVWRRSKTPNDYARWFDEWIDRDAAAWIRRDRAHPCVVMWSVGNEIHDTHLDFEDGAATLSRLLALVRAHDPYGHAPPTLCSNYMPWENTQRCADIVKLIGYNYGERLYAAHHAAHPDWILFGAETCATVQSRGVYHFPLAKPVLADDDLQCSALGNSATSWGAKSVEACILDDRNAPFSLGQFIWAGQDYLGEPTPYHTKNCYFGHIDTAGFPKDSYYLFQAAWADPKTPVLHLYPYWDFSPGQTIDVRVATNLSRVALFLNGEKIGEADCRDRVAADFQVAYRPGALHAVGYDATGNAVAESVRKSFGDAVTLRVSQDAYESLVFATITAVDADGNAVENANCRARVSVEGGTLLALDNGDATDYEPYQSGARRLFSGKLLAIVLRCGDAMPRVTAAIDETDVPIRKIELIRDGYSVTARVFPKNAIHRALAWRLTDAGGIDSPVASLSVAEDGLSATVSPRGDGEVFVRCAAMNGKPHPALISAISFHIEGFGQALLDPYGFVSGGLYGASNAELTNGNERGVATPRDGESHVGFCGLNFGDFGSDELTLSLFPLSKEPFAFEIWEGMPDGGGEKLRDALWDKGSVWNTYQDITVRLPRRLRGVACLCLVFRQKVHIKGFRFARLEKAFARLGAADNDGLYGDAYRVAGECVEGIGNNVTILFSGMDFGGGGASKVSVSWRSDLERNAVQVAFGGERRLIELPRAEAAREAVFSLGAPLTGRGDVSLIFLPGCSLDLGSIQFMR